MLAQRAEGNEFGEAVRIWAPVYPLVVRWAFQVLIEAIERAVRRVAKEALERHPIPRPLRRPR